MNKQPSLTAIILTYNEEIHLQRCIDSIKGVCQKIIIVDSFSTDNTEIIAKENSIDFYQNPWKNHATQFNWGLININITTDWVLRLDADEYISSDLEKDIKEKLDNLPNNISAIEVYLRRVFLNRHIKRGVGKIKMIRLFRYKKAFVENTWMDEHIKVIEGDTITFDSEFSDHNLNDIGWWTQKHNGYSVREAIQLLDIELSILENNVEGGELNEQANSKRKVKMKYAKSPLFLRSFLYFIYRYFFKLGFLEGKEGFIWHFLQGWWYRTLVDVKIYEIKKHCGNDVEKIKTYIKNIYNIDL